MQSTKKLTNSFLVKKFISICCIGCILGISVCFFLIYSEQQDDANYLLSDASLAAILGIIIGVVVYFSGTILNKLLPWQVNAGNRLLVGVLLHFIIAYGLSYLFFFSYSNYILDSISFVTDNKTLLIKLAIVLVVLALIFEIIYFALYSYYSYAKLQIESVKQERKQIELQLNALKSQLSPHFLFNSLNAISSLLYKDVSKAESFIRDLAKMYDFTLKSYHTSTISLQQELDFVESYLSLLEVRFTTKFNCSIDVEKQLKETKIPPLTLQMLVENALKHNVLSEDHPLEIKIFSDNNNIIVENNITETPNNITSFNIGIKNIRKRYALLFNKAISVKRSTNFKVELPVIS